MTRLLAGGPDVESRKCEEIFLFSETSKRPPETTQPLIQWIPELFPGVAGEVKRPGHDAHSHSASEDDKNEWRHTSTLAIRFHGVSKENSAFTSAL